MSNTCYSIRQSVFRLSVVRQSVAILIVILLNDIWLSLAIPCVSKQSAFRQSVILLSVIMPSVFMLNVVRLSVS